MVFKCFIVDFHYDVSVIGVGVDQHLVIDGGIEDPQNGIDCHLDGKCFAEYFDGIAHHAYLSFGKGVLARFRRVVHIVFYHIGHVFWKIVAGINEEIAIEVRACSLSGSIFDVIVVEAGSGIAPNMP